MNSCLLLLYLALKSCGEVILSSNRLNHELTFRTRKRTIRRPGWKKEKDTWNMKSKKPQQEQFSCKLVAEPPGSWSKKGNTNIYIILRCPQRKSIPLFQENQKSSWHRVLMKICHPEQVTNPGVVPQDDFLQSLDTQQDTRMQ